MNVSRLLTRHCVLSTLSVQHWEEKIQLDPEYCIEELRFWRTYLNSLKSGIGSSFISLYVYLYVIQVLALMRIISVINFGNHLNAPKVLLEHVEERAYRQLFFSRIVRPTNSGGFSRQVAWFTDSQSPVQIVEVGSMKLGLHRLAVKIFQFCEGPVDPANGK